MADDEGVRALPGQVIDAYGRLDVVVNNAGVMQEAPAVDLAVGDFRRLLDVNLTAYFLLAQAAHPHFAGSGVILNIGSIFGTVGASHAVGYCTSKAGVDGLTRALAAEWARDGIRVLSLAPGYVESEISRGILEDERMSAQVLKRIPQRPVAAPDEIGAFAAFLTGADAAFATGATFIVDGGQITSV